MKTIEFKILTPEEKLELKRMKKEYKQSFKTRQS